MKTNLMTKMGLMVATLLVSSMSFAQDVGVVVGVRNDQADGKNGIDIKGKTGFGAGVVAKFEIAEPLQIRTGFLVNQRAYDVTTPLGFGGGELKLTNVEIPVGLLWKFSDYGGVFAGPAISLNLAKECPGGSCNGADVNSSPLALQFGGSFKVAPQFGFEVYYETMTSAIAKDVENGRGLVANVMITFD